MPIRPLEWKSQILPGLIVFLIALPLSLGIAMASGVPPISGLIAAIVGGLIVSRMNGSHITINGPAAGLIVVVLHGVETLGNGNPFQGYRSLLAAVVVSGLLLAVAGKLKAGRLGEVFPSSAVHGMLSAIGVIIFAKQFHTALGVIPEAKSTLGLIGEIPASLARLNPEIALISGISLLFLIGLPLLKANWVKRIPAPMLVVVVGIALGHYFDLEHEHKYLFLSSQEFDIGPRFLVSLPARIWDGITLPDFGAVWSRPFLSLVVSLTLVQGLETLLSASAVDRFDPLKRRSDLNRDLTAVGLGSAISGAVGGLPIIAEIVRSRANVSNGATNSWSNFFHGFFMLVFVALFPSLIHQIPLACLASILIVTGYRLASPSQFKHAFAVGTEQLVIFVVTLITTLATDLLIGVGTGVILKIVLHVARGMPLRTFFRPDVEYDEQPGAVRMAVRNGAVFTNYLGLKKFLDRIPPRSKVVLDLSEAEFVDHTVMERLNEFAESYRRAGGEAEILGLERMRSSSPHPLAARRK